MFRKTQSFEGRRLTGMKKSLESRADILKVKVVVTDKSNRDEPKLKLDTVRALAQTHPHLRRDMAQDAGGGRRAAAGAARGRAAADRLRSRGRKNGF